MKKETLKHKEAFEYYYGLGDSRGIREVAQKFGVSLTSVGKWSVAFDWQNRVAERDDEVARMLEKRLKNDIIRDRTHYYMLIKKAMSIFQKNLVEGSVKITTVADFEKLLKSVEMMSAGISGEKHISGDIIVRLDDD